MLPTTSTIKKIQGGYILKHKTMLLSKEEARSLADEYENMLKDPRCKYIIIDNREAEGTWPPELREVWTECSEKMKLHVGQKSITLCPSEVNKMISNQMYQAQGLYDVSRAYTNDELDEAGKFLGVTLK